jgi:hypothetical protein
LPTAASSQKARIVDQRQAALLGHRQSGERVQHRRVDVKLVRLPCLDQRIEAL